ncbi:MAG: murein biosynthesis integral membrane protein MurJ [Candidatus Andersenbacteria bacterium]|nr:murein biosynthesis integral membrane protein MurJ [Candidatus Andersenbacteria bacterium]MBI3251082.1 murein biosynthesis integral membrane protein MurJ [Candidatus Andersenbacteria bacterium]
MVKNGKSGNGSIVSAAFIIGVASLASAFVGLVRQRVFSTHFGAGDTFDAFIAAFRVPDLIFNLVVIGALSAAFIPMFTEKLVKKSGEEEAYTFASAVLNILIIAVVVLAVVYAALAPWFVPLIAPGFEGEKLQLTIRLSQIMSVQPILLGASFVFSGILNSYKRFVAYALAPIFYNLGIIAGVIWLVPMMGINGLGWGVVLGAALHILVQFPAVLRVGFKWKPVLTSSNSDLKKLWKMMVPRVFGLAAQQINLLVVTILGSGLLVGSIAVFNLANNIYNLPITIFGIAFSQAAFPTLAEYAATKRHSEFRGTLTRTFRYILFFAIPLSALFYLFRAQIVRVLFGDGAFDWEDTVMTFETLGFLVISIFAQATIPLLTRAFYAKQDTKTPVIISIISIVANVALALWLAPRMGVQGLALAFSIGAIIQLLLLLGILHRQLEGFDDVKVLASLMKIVVASIAGAIAAQLLKYPIASFVDMQRFWGVLTQLIGAVFGGLLVYLVICWLVGSPELEALKRYLPRRFKMASGTDTPRFEGHQE